jgi:hypothetical protein
MTPLRPKRRRDQRRCWPPLAEGKRASRTSRSVHAFRPNASLICVPIPPQRESRSRACRPAGLGRHGSRRFSVGAVSFPNRQRTPADGGGPAAVAVWVPKVESPAYGDGQSAGGFCVNGGDTFGDPPARAHTDLGSIWSRSLWTDQMPQSGTTSIRARLNTYTAYGIGCAAV